MHNPKHKRAFGELLEANGFQEGITALALNQQACRKVTHRP